MKNYKNLGGDSSVVAYEYGDNYIDVRFKLGRFTLYTYTYQSAGSSNVEKMKKLADIGQGLNSFIMKNIKDKYSKKS